MYIFRFNSEPTCEAVMEEKFWDVANKPLVLRKWQPGMRVLKLSLSSVPVLVKLIHLPMEFWTSTCLSHIASGVGKPLSADSFTVEKQRLGYARVLVEINVNSDCPRALVVERKNGSRVTIGVQYPWLPVKCKSCNGFGHVAYACTKCEKKTWDPKMKTGPSKQYVVVVNNRLRRLEAIGGELGKHK